MVSDRGGRLAGIATAGDRQSHILLNPAERQARGFAGCNTFFGSYELDGASLTFGPVGATRMACPDLETGLETAVFRALENSRTWEMVDGELLLLAGGDVLARFSREEHTHLAGPVWQWMQTLYNDGSRVGPVDSENYTVQFQGDGAISVKADCNHKGGTYSSPCGEKSIAIEITHSTMAAYPTGSLEGAFEKGLSAAALYFMRDGKLYIDLKYDSGTMRFVELKQCVVQGKRESEGTRCFICHSLAKVKLFGFCDRYRCAASEQSMAR